jgi:hypothetical protein
MAQINGPSGDGAPALSMSQMGLCATCNFVATCTQRKNWCGPVHFCEEFDDHQPRKTGNRVVPEKAPGGAPSACGDGSVPRKGLCVNCDLKDTCSYPVPEGGVWHCEEYR